jgi:hypothetical protein
MTRLVSTVLSAAQVAAILARHSLELRNIDTVPGSKITAEMMAVFERDPKGEPQIVQYRIDVTVDEVKEDWRG